MTKNKVMHKKKNCAFHVLFLTIVIAQSQPIYALSLQKEDVIIDEKLLSDNISQNQMYKENYFEKSVTIFLNKLVPLEYLFEEQIKLFDKDISKIEKIKIISTNDFSLKSKDFEFLNDFGFKYIDLSQAKCENNVIPINAFKDNKDLETFIFPYSIEKISSFAFKNCINLRGILEIPKNIKIIEPFAFSDCGYDNFILPSTFDNIPKFFAVRWRNLKNLEIDNNIKTINEGAFVGCEIENLSINHEVKFEQNCF